MDDDVKKKFTALERRVRRLESGLSYENSEVVEEVIEEQEPLRESKPMPNISFTQVITFLGILGIIIGVISFFFYAVANNWIGKTAQVLMGIVLGLALFTTSYFVKEKNINWATIVFGGALFIELLSISVGVLVYKVMPDTIGVLFSILFILASLIIALKFESRSVAYFAVVGGYLIPFITGYVKNDIFVLSLNVILTAALIAISYKLKWSDLRFTSFVITAVFIIASSGSFNYAALKAIPIMYLITIGLLFHISTLIGMIKFRDNVNALDSAIVAFLPIIIFTQLYQLLSIPLTAFGLLVMVYAIVKLGEIYYLKTQISDLPQSIKYTFLAAGFAILNIGIVFMVHEITFEWFIILFAIQQALFMYLATKQEENILYKIFSYIFLGLTALWFVFIIFSARYFEIGEATAWLVILAVITAGFYIQLRAKIDYFINTGAFIILGFLTLYNLAQYVELVSGSSEVMQIVLSVLWLGYSIFMYTQVQTSAGKTLTGILLGITLIKIAFVDLLFLEGIFRIVGFIIFGVLLLAGGYIIGGNKK